MIVELSIIPIGVGTSLSDYVAEVMKIIQESRLKYESHSMGQTSKANGMRLCLLLKNAMKGFTKKVFRE